MNEASRFRYLDALGIPDFLYAQPSISDVNVSKINAQCLVIEDNVDASDSFCMPGASRDFLLKMLGAIGVDKQNIVCVNTPNDIEKYETKVVLLMGDIAPIKDSFVTHHPSDILKNEQLKREAWEVLKKIQQWLK